MKKKRRFVVSYKESGVRVMVDTTTGVNYVYMSSGYGGGVCVLVDSDGKPLVTAIPTDEDAYL